MPKHQQAGGSGSAVPTCRPSRRHIIYSAICDFASLHAAYCRARRGKRHLSEVLDFERDLEGELFRLQDELDAGTYRTGDYYTFTVREPKARLVAALPFRDRVLQHALVAQLEPLREPAFLTHSYACRPGRGLHQGADTVERWMRAIKRNHGAVYALRTDVRSYFASVDQSVLLEQLARRIRCPRTLELCAGILRSWPAGLPIGNLTSQLWANVHLHDLDLFAKHRCRARNYARYMDDCVILHPEKAQLHTWRRELEAFLGDTLHLQFNAKTQVFPIAGTAPGGRALDWLGYRIWPTHRRLRADSIKRMRRHFAALHAAYHRGDIPLERVTASVQAWIGHAAHADTYRVRSQVLGALAF